MANKESRAVRFERYGGIEVLEVVPVERPVPGPGEVLVEVRAAGINPGEAAIREGRLRDRLPATFPSGQGTDFAGVVTELGEGATSFVVGDEVLGFVEGRGSHATHVVVPVTQLVPKPATVSWEQAGALQGAGATAYAANEAVAVGQGDVVIVSGAAGGVGSLAAQLARLRGAEVIGLASEENHPWLAEHGVVPVDDHRHDARERIRAASGRIDAFVDTQGEAYLELADELGVRPDRITSTVDRLTAGAALGTGSAGGPGIDLDEPDPGQRAATSTWVLSELADRIARGGLELPIAGTYSLERVREAYEALERGHAQGQIVLVP